MAVNLYFLLQTLAQGMETGKASGEALMRHRFLLSATGLTMDEWLEARYRLEGLGLLHTYVEEREEVTYFYRLTPPLAPPLFFQSDVLSVMLLNRLGEGQYQWLQHFFSSPPAPWQERPMREVSKGFHDVYSPLSQRELMQADGLASLPVEKESEQPLRLGNWPFDTRLMRSQVGAVFGLDKHWNRQVEERILQLAALYQLKEDEMARLIQEHLFAREAIDWEQFRREVMAWAERRHQQKPGLIWTEPARELAATSPDSPVSGKPEQLLTDAERHRQDLERISPYALLHAYSNGTKVADSDLRLVYSLLHDYQLKPGVVNVLIEYVMFTNNYKLPKALVEKIASHWKRLRIETVSEALGLCRKEHQLYRRWPLKGGERKGSASEAPGSERKAPRQVRSEPLPKSVRQQLDEVAGGKTVSMEQERLQKEKEARALELLRALGELDAGT
jgi:replication initiation and membrane attachment protein